jgi:hypothetical protein
VDVAGSVRTPANGAGRCLRVKSWAKRIPG